MAVNLDALISREDFEVKGENSFTVTLQVLQIRDLEENSFVYQTLRKPDFQRETNEWSTEKVCDFIKSFLDGDLIPSIILWNSSGVNFVIDGAHRLSALISWVFDDYGDGHISKKFFGYTIPAEQVDIAEKTRNYIKRKIGTYKEHQIAINNPQSANPEILIRAKRLATLGLQLQWVPGNAEKAEHSFFKINEQATPINETEKELLKTRKNSTSIASRAIVRSGTGHKYWAKFEETTQKSIEDIAENINNLLFSPKLENPIKTLDLPLAGKGYSAKSLSLILDIVNISNKIDGLSNMEDETGMQTISVLKQTKKMLSRISGSHPSSLGLHPAVYFYSVSGRYQITAFYSILLLFTDNEGSNSFFIKFTALRRRFEDFLLSYKSFINQINLKYGSGLKSYKRLKDLYIFILNEIERGLNNVQILEAVSQSEYNFLNFDEIDFTETDGSNFSRNVKSATFLKDALKNPLRCKICDGLIHKNSISIDHIDRKEDGGLGTLDNAQLTHPYCNSTIKN